MKAVDSAVASDVPSRLSRPTLGGALGVLVVAAGVAIGLRSLADNSFLTHLATGRVILDTGSVPTHDSYTFTAAGEPWVVQSWVASILYAAIERLGGLDAVRMLMGATTGLLAGLCWHLLRPAEGVISRLTVSAMALSVGGGLWSERPYLLGLLAFALVALAAEGRISPIWLLAVGWLWVNTHGSFPLGLVYLVVALVGGRLDGGDGAVELRCLRWAVPGMLAGAIGPLGVGVLLFPLELLGRQDVLANVIEWQAPGFTSVAERAFLLQVMTAIVLLARRPSFRGAMVVSVFTAAALVGSRNVIVASLAMLPTMAVALRGLGSVSSEDRPRYARLAGVAGGLLGLLVVVVRTGLPALNLEKYPVDVLAYLEEAQVDTREHRLAAPDIVGNFIGYVYGPDGRVFYDDRFDMFPDEVSSAALAIAHVESDVFDQLGRYHIDMLTVPRTSPLAALAVIDPAWRTLYQDEAWVLSCRRGAALAGTVGTC